MTKITLQPMSDAMYYEYFKEYENDPDLYMDKSKYEDYTYSDDKVAKYIERKKEKQQIPMAILHDKEIIGELIFKELVPGNTVLYIMNVREVSYDRR